MTKDPVVWSSETGDQRPKQKQELQHKKETKTSALGSSLPAKQQTIHLHRDSKHRAGKGVVLIKGLQLTEMDLTNLAKTIKQACGSGGTIKDGIIEIQGDQRDKISQLLQNLGYKVKIAGG